MNRTRRPFARRFPSRSHPMTATRCPTNSSACRIQLDSAITPNPARSFPRCLTASGFAEGHGVMEQAHDKDPSARLTAKAANPPGQVVVVFQGGGALGAYQGGVYQALHEAGIEPNWVIGTSIGAINAAIIAGNDFDKRLDRLRAFWDRMERKPFWSAAPFAPALALLGGNVAAQMMTIFGGI